jgi:hypothetical protein
MSGIRMTVFVGRVLPVRYLPLPIDRDISALERCLLFQCTADVLHWGVHLQCTYVELSCSMYGCVVHIRLHVAPMSIRQVQIQCNMSWLTTVLMYKDRYFFSIAWGLYHSEHICVLISPDEQWCFTIKGVHW